MSWQLAVMKMYMVTINLKRHPVRFAYFHKLYLLSSLMFSVSQMNG